MCTRRRTPAALQAATIFFGSSTWASAKSRLYGNLHVAAVQDADQVDHRIVTAHQLGQGFLAMDVGFRHLDAGLHDQRLGPLAPTGRDGDLDAALRQTIDDVGTDETATPQQQDLFDVHLETPEYLVRKNRILNVKVATQGAIPAHALVASPPGLAADRRVLDSLRRRAARPRRGGLSVNPVGR